MNLILVLLSLVTIAYAGVEEATQDIENQAQELWNKFCNKGHAKEKDGMLWIYCKQSLSTEAPVTMNHEPVPFTPQFEDQVVFVKPPKKSFIHKVPIRINAAGPKTVIYVKPTKDDHEVSVVTEQPNPVTYKPTIYYLKGQHDNDNLEGNAPIPSRTDPIQFDPNLATTEPKANPWASQPTQPQSSAGIGGYPNRNQQGYTIQNPQFQQNRAFAPVNAQYFASPSQQQQRVVPAAKGNNNYQHVGSQNQGNKGKNY